MNKLTIVTGASSNHFSCLKNLLYSISIYEPIARTIVYDLGLKLSESEELMTLGYQPRRFLFEKYPPHVNIEINRGEYAWKPIIISEVICEIGGMVLWLDAGNLIHRKLDKLRSILFYYGLYSPRSKGNIAKWTHPGTLEYLNAFSIVDKINRNAAIVGFTTGHSGIDELVNCWKLCALDPHCIAPEGSNRSNHRQDQAVLSILIYQYQKIHKYLLINDTLGISIHNDRLSREEVNKKLGIQ